MASAISTDRGVSSAKPGPDGRRLEYTIKGERGLRLRVTGDKSGAITRIWSLLYTRKSDGKKCRLTLGEYPAMTLAEACRLSGRYRNDVRDAKDPAAERREARQAMTFTMLAEQWLERRAKVKKRRSWPEDARMLRRNILPVIGSMKAEAVTKGDILSLIHGIVDRGAKYQANRNLRLIHSIYRWGWDHDLVGSNPASRIAMPCKEVARSRVFSDEEIRRFWAGILAAPMTRPVQLVLCLALLTGARINELAEARRIEFDLPSALWIIPGRRALPGKKTEGGTKNKIDHVLPLSDLATGLFTEAFELAGPSEWVFPSAITAGPIGVKAASRAWGRTRTALNLKEIRVHDFRRSFATIAGRCGYSDFHIGLCLNHSSTRGKVTSIYNRNEYLAEKRQVVADVERYILSVIGQAGSCGFTSEAGLEPAQRSAG